MGGRTRPSHRAPAGRLHRRVRDVGHAPRRLRLGHFGQNRWVQSAGNSSLAEIFVAGEVLARGAAPVVATVLHEGAHFLAAVRSVKDTSRGGRYHNQRFRQIAEQEMGLKLSYSSQRGWSDTELPNATAALYGPTIKRLQAGADDRPPRRDAPRPGHEAQRPPPKLPVRLPATPTHPRRRLRLRPGAHHMRSVRRGLHGPAQR